MALSADKQRKAWLDAEIGTLRKPWRNRIRVALVYPNRYHVAMASLGFQSVYRQLNALDHVVCERAFLPEPAAPATPPVSLESGRPLAMFDCLAFSIAYEHDHVHVLQLLHQAGLPLPAARRGASLPLVVAGGVSCFLNPEPLAPFIDCFLIGEAEGLLAPFFDRFDPRQEREPFLLRAARELPGVYVPSFYDDRYHADGTLAALAPNRSVPAKVRRVYAFDIGAFATRSTVITRQAGFADAHLVEVSRGCAHGCRFCAAGYVYRPPRFRSADELLAAMARGSARTGKIGLLGAAVSDLPGLPVLCDWAAGHDLQLSFSSLRADALDDKLVAALRAGRLKTATIAPEAGSERLRQVINKGLDETTILRAVETLVAGGIPNLKLYFMVGLPTETDDDVAALVTLVQRIKSRFLDASRPRGRMGSITVSLNCFVPKPFTPFQWVGMAPPALLKQRIKTIQAGLKAVANVQVQADPPRQAFVQAVLARGDRRVGHVLEAVRHNGGNWPRAFKGADQAPEFYVARQREREEVLPWDVIDHGLDKNFLWREYRRALQAKATPPCPVDPQQCRLCGVCSGGPEAKVAG